MQYEVVTLAEKKIVGLSSRTGNEDPQMAAVIGGLWQKFMGEGVWQSIQHPANPYCVCLYSDYDATSYAVTVGAEVTENGNPELTQQVIPAGKYARFCIKGDVVKDVGAAWNEIWAMPLARSYTGDFEEYLSNVDGVAEVAIYIALQ